MTTNALQQLKLAHSGLSPSPLALGCEPLGGADWGQCDPASLREAVRCALDLGITVFDTADIYGLGKSESELAKALGPDRHRAFIVTKFGVRWEANAPGKRATTFKDASPAYVRLALEASLKRLRIEAVPLYLVHWPDPATPLDATLETLQRLRQEGKVLNYGLSNFAAQELVAAKGRGISAVETPFSLIAGPSSEAILDAARERGLVALAYGVFAQGLLTGKYSAASVFDATDRRHRLPHFAVQAWPENERLLDVMRRSAKKHNVFVSQIALRWVLEDRRVSVAIAGAKSPQQVQRNVQALDFSLDDEDRALLEAVRRDG